MNIYLGSLGIATIAVSATVMIASGDAAAGDITSGSKPFVGAVDLAEVRSTLKARPVTGDSGEWPPYSIPTPQSESSYTRAEARQDYLRSRDDVRNLDGEGGRSSHFKMTTPDKSSYTRSEARQDYLSSREEVRSLDGEGSGSTHFKMKDPRGVGATMGAQAR